MKKEKQLFKTALYILAIITLLVFGVIGFRSYQEKTNNHPTLLSSPSVTPSPVKNTAPTDKISCEKLGGKWQSVDSPDNRHICNLPITDGGKKCTDSSQCESYCQAEEGTKNGIQTTGRCYEWRETTTGCMREVRNGIFETEWCY